MKDKLYSSVSEFSGVYRHNGRLQFYFGDTVYMHESEKRRMISQVGETRTAWGTEFGPVVKTLGTFLPYSPIRKTNSKNWTKW